MLEEIKKIFINAYESIDLVQLGLFIGIMILGYIFKKIVKRSISKLFKYIDKRTKPDLFEKYLKPILRPIGLFIILVALYIAVNIVHIPKEPLDFKKYILKILMIVIIFDISWMFLNIVNLLTMYFEKFTETTESKLDDQLVPIIRKFMRIIIFVLTTLFVLQQLGYSVSGLIAGLGVGGFALAFASKDALANIFGSIIIFTDRPFQIGDWIKTSSGEGIVEEVGLRSTKIRTFEKTLITIPNSKISNMEIENVSARHIRRVYFMLGIEYGTPVDTVNEVVDEIKRIINEHDGVDKSFNIVKFTNFGASSLDIMVYYFTTSTVWEEHLRVKQEINLNIMQRLEEMEVGIAFPSTSVYIEKIPDEMAIKK